MSIVQLFIAINWLMFILTAILGKTRKIKKKDYIHGKLVIFKIKKSLISIYSRQNNIS